MDGGTLHLRHWIRAYSVGRYGSVGELEDDVDGGFYCYGVAVEEIGAVAPLADGVEGGLLEDRGTAQDAEVGDGAVFGNGSGEDHGAFLAHGAGQLWIDGDDLAQKQALGEGGGKTERGFDVGANDPGGGQGAEGGAGAAGDAGIESGDGAGGCGAGVIDDDDAVRNQARRGKGVRGCAIGPGCGARSRLCRCRRGRRRRDCDEEGHGLAWQGFRIDERDEDQREEDGAVKDEGCDHPAAAAGADGSVGFEGGVFKHGLPPGMNLSAVREAKRRGQGAGGLAARASKSRRRAEAQGATARCFFHPIRNHCGCVDTAYFASVPRAQKSMRRVVRQLRYTPEDSITHDVGVGMNLHHLLFLAIAAIGNLNVLAQDGGAGPNPVPSPAPNPDATLAYIHAAWDTLTRSMTDCHSLVDIKVTVNPVIYMPADVPAPPEVVALKDKCNVQVLSLPRRIEKLADVRPEELHAQGLLYLPHPYVVPGGRFNEMYGWDSYFIVLGLEADHREALAKGMVDNFLFEIEHYGAVLNANRTYYLTRSQPPFLTSMIRAVYENPASFPATPAGRAEAHAWLEHAYTLAEKDY